KSSAYAKLPQQEISGPFCSTAVHQRHPHRSPSPQSPRASKRILDRRQHRPFLDRIQLSKICNESPSTQEARQHFLVFLQRDDNRGQPDAKSLPSHYTTATHRKVAVSHQSRDAGRIDDEPETAVTR